MDAIETQIEKLQKGIENPFVSQPMKEKMKEALIQLEMRNINVPVPAKKPETTVLDLENRLKILNLMVKKTPQVKPRIKIVEMMLKKAKEAEKTSSKTKKTSSKSDKIKVKSIEIVNSEGDNSNYDKFPKKYNSWKAANEAVKPIADNNKGYGGYNKTKFVVTFEDGEEYEGRLDVTYDRYDSPYKSDNVVGNHINEFLNYELYGDNPQTTDETKKEIENFLNTYDLGISSYQRVNKVSAKELVDEMIKWVNENGVDPDYAHKIKYIKAEDVEKFMQCGVDDNVIKAFYCGIHAGFDWKVDGELQSFNRVQGIFPYMDDYIEGKIKEAIKYCKTGKFEIGLKYPNFDWSKILKGKAEEKVIEGNKSKGVFDNVETISVYKILIYPNIVIGGNIGEITFSNPVVGTEDVDRSKSVFDSPYLGLVTSDPKVLYNTLKSMASQADSYVKDVDVLVNGLGGVGYQELDRNKIKYEDGGELKDAKKLKKSERFQLKIIEGLKGSNNGMDLNSLMERMGFSNYRFGIYASDEEYERVENGIKNLIKNGYVEEKGVGYSVTQKGAEYLREFDYSTYSNGGEIGRNWIQYDKNHKIDTESGMIVINEADLKNIKPSDVKGMDRLFSKGGETFKGYGVEIRRDKDSYWEQYKENLTKEEADKLAEELKSSGKYHQVVSQVPLPFADGGETIPTYGSWVERYADGDYRVSVRGNGMDFRHTFNDVFKPSELDRAVRFAKKIAENNGVSYIGLDTTSYDFVKSGSLSPDKNHTYEVVRGADDSIVMSDGNDRRKWDFTGAKVAPPNNIEFDRLKSILTYDTIEAPSFQEAYEKSKKKYSNTFGDGGAIKEYENKAFYLGEPVLINIGQQKGKGVGSFWVSANVSNTHPNRITVERDAPYGGEKIEHDFPNKYLTSDYIVKEKDADKYAKGGQTDDKWMQEAEKEMEKEGTVGLFTKKAEKAGKTTVEFAKEVLNPKNKDKYDLKTRREAQFMKNANPELFKDGGEVKDVSEEIYKDTKWVKQPNTHIRKIKFPFKDDVEHHYVPSLPYFYSYFKKYAKDKYNLTDEEVKKSYDMYKRKLMNEFHRIHNYTDNSPFRIKEEQLKIGQYAKGGEVDNPFELGLIYNRDSNMGGTYSFKYKGENDGELMFENIMHKDYGGGNIEGYSLSEAINTFNPKYANGGETPESKFKVGDKVYYLPKLSGFDNSTPLEINSVYYKTEDDLSSMLNVDFEPTYMYHFKGTSLGAVEKDLSSTKPKFADGGETKKKNKRFGVFLSGNIIGEVAYAEDIHDLINNRMLKRWSNWETIKYKDDDGKTVVVTRYFVDDDGMTIQEVIDDYYLNATEFDLEDDIAVLDPKNRQVFGKPKEVKGWLLHEQGGELAVN